jgi:hypothetical protein
MVFVIAQTNEPFTPAVRVLPGEHVVQLEGTLVHVKQFGLHKKQRLLASSWAGAVQAEQVGKPLAPLVHALHPVGQGAQ